MDYLLTAAADWLAWVVGLTLPWLVGWLLVSGVDDLVLLGAYFVGCPAARGPSARQLESTRRKQIAIFVPCWREDAVIGAMLRHNLGAGRYKDVTFFVGVYPNDQPTADAVAAVAAEDSRVHVAVCPTPGPTSKADCLNATYRRMAGHEAECGKRFELVVVHDAEDLIHPDALTWLNYFAESYAMIQLPVLALPTPCHRMTHGTYCDDFAQFHGMDLAARCRLGGFLPSAGVGTAYHRSALERLEEESGTIFDPSSLTEDYELGFRLHRMGARQLFLPICVVDGAPVATREYFPQSFGAALRQRTRWTTGIALQGWERHGWGVGWERYWFWRDRKGLIGHPVSLLATLVGLAGALLWLGGFGSPLRDPLLPATAALGMVQILVRAVLSGRIYGWRFAAGVPVRLLLGHVLNTLAVVRALGDYAGARAVGRRVAWRKTDHHYPGMAALSGHRRKVGEILMGLGYLDGAGLSEALAKKPVGVLLGRYLVDRGRLTEGQLYEALSVQSAVPLGGGAVTAPALARVFPPSVIRQRRVVPLCVDRGAMIVATPELPDDSMHQELRDWTRLPVRFRLVTPGEFERLCEQLH